MNSMPTRFAPLLVLLLAGCASWNFVGTESHPALKPGTQLATFERGRGADHETKVEVRSGGSDVAASSVDRVMPYCVALTTPDAAIAYSDVVRRLSVADSGARGMAVEPDATLPGTGGSGRYSRDDAAAWGIAFEPQAQPYAGGFAVGRVVLFPPMPHPVLINAPSPWRLVYVREIVFPDGTIRQLDEKTLTNGSDAARYAKY
jgi:hypothetical protein